MNSPPEPPSTLQPAGSPALQPADFASNLAATLVDLVRFAYLTKPMTCITMRSVISNTFWNTITLFG